MNKTLKYYLLLILGLALFSLFIWFRFLRQRLPRDIPFHPKFLGLIILFIICLSYVYALIVIYRKPKNNKYLSDIIMTLLKPLVVFDDFLKGSMSGTLHNRLLKKWHRKLVYPKKVIIRYNIIPRILLLTILSTDVYFYNELDYVYKVIFLTFFLLWVRYLKYSLKKSLDKDIALLSLNVESVVTSYVYGVHPAEWPENAVNLDPEDEDDDMPETMSLPLDIFVNYQTSRIMNSLTPVEYYIFCTKEYYTEYKKQYNKKHLQSQDHKNIEFIMLPQIETIIALSVILEKYNKTSYEDLKIKLLKTLIYINHLLCWLFILIITLPHVDWLDIVSTLLNTVYTENDPFSGHAMLQDLITYIKHVYKY